MIAVGKVLNGSLVCESFLALTISMYAAKLTRSAVRISSVFYDMKDQSTSRTYLSVTHTDIPCFLAMIFDIRV